MHGQISLFGDEKLEAVGSSTDNICTYACVAIDVAARSINGTFTYALDRELFERCSVGSTVLVPFGRRCEVGFVIDIADSLDGLQSSNGLDPAKVKFVQDVSDKPAFSKESARIAAWMSKEYVAPLSECIRLFLPPGTTARAKKDGCGVWHLECTAPKPVVDRVVSLTEKGRSYTPDARAHRQRQLLEALKCGPVTLHDLKTLYSDPASTVRALERKGIVAVEQYRVRRGSDVTTTLSSAKAEAPTKLTEGQTQALSAIDQAIEKSTGDVVLIDGVTGSGKTEVYLAAIERVLADGKSACVLVPEISLTAQTVGRFRSRFGNKVAVFHSRLSTGERFDQWEMVQSGEARVVVGARSALFCPIDNLGLIVIDEEHEQSYKQGSTPRYHAREVAAAMARLQGCPLVLGSATPSAESLHRCKTGEYFGSTWTRVTMAERPGGAVLPEVVVVDLRKEFADGYRSMFSRTLHDALLQTVERGEKAVLLHNRRGFASFLMCRECGCVPTCKHCSTALTYHERTHELMCHTCGATYSVRAYPDPSSSCPECGSRYLAKMGVGTQQVEDALRSLLGPYIPIIRMDADTTRAKGAHQQLLEEFDAADSAVLLGTQMIAKGLDFPEVTLVGVINADYSLNAPDFRASERAFDLLEQVAGRAGRGDKPGTVIIQTYTPNNPAIRAVATHVRSTFTDHDLSQRSEALYPPYVRLVNIVVSGTQERHTKDYIDRFAKELRAVTKDTQQLSTSNHVDVHADKEHSIASLSGSLTTNEVLILGPTSCVIARAKDRYRFHVIVKCPGNYPISEQIDSVLRSMPPETGIRISVDVDAYDLM